MATDMTYNPWSNNSWKPKPAINYFNKSLTQTWKPTLTAPSLSEYNKTKTTDPFGGTQKTPAGLSKPINSSTSGSVAKQFDQSKSIDWNKTAGTAAKIFDSVPKYNTNDPTIEAGNQVYDAASNVVMGINPVAGAIMKGVGAGIDVANNLSGGTAWSMKGDDAPTFWDKYNKGAGTKGAFLTPTGILAQAYKTSVEGTDANLNQSINRGYTPSKAIGDREIATNVNDMSKFFTGRDLITEAKKKVKRLNTENLLKSWAVSKDTQEQLNAQQRFGDIQTVNKQKLLGGLNTRVLSAKKGTTINPAKLRNITNKVKSNIEKFAEGGQLNLIPEGALHARKHNLPDDISESVTNKGIPVITYTEGGDITQHAEIEVNEIIFAKPTTNKIEELFKRYNELDSEEEKNKLAIECGKFLASEILENTEDRTGLIDTIE